MLILKVPAELHMCWKAARKLRNNDHRVLILKVPAELCMCWKAARKLRNNDHRVLILKVPCGTLYVLEGSTIFKI